MSTDQDMYAEREEVMIPEGDRCTMVHYDSIAVGNPYFVKLISGAYTVYRKSNLFDDELLGKVKTESEAIGLILGLPS